MKLKRPVHLTRDSGLYLVGLGGIIYEIITNRGDNATLLILLGAMVGLPSILHVDEKRSTSREDPPPPERPRKSEPE